MPGVVVVQFVPYISFLIRRLCLSTVRVARSTATVMPSRASSWRSSSASVSRARAFSLLRICMPKGAATLCRGRPAPAPEH